MPFPFSLLCLLSLGMLNIDAEKLTIVSQTPQGWDKSWERGEPGGGKEREIRLQSVPSLRGGGWGDKLGVWCPF